MVKPKNSLLDGTAGQSRFYTCLARCVGGSVTVIGLLILLGHIVNLSAISADWPASPFTPLLSSVALILMGLSIMVLLDPAPLRERPVWIRAGGIATLSGTTLLGIGTLTAYLLSNGFSLINLFISPSLNSMLPSGMTALLLTITSGCLWCLVLGRRSPPIIAYGVGLPALFTTYMGVYALLAHSLDLPVMYSFRASSPALISFILVGISLLIGTIPLGGILNPLCAHERKGRVIAIVGCLLSFGLLPYSLNNVLQAPKLALENLNSIEQMRWFLHMELITVLLATLFMLVAMRALYYYQESVSLNRRQKEISEALRQSRALFERVVEGSSDGIYDWDLTNHHSFWNDRNYELLDIPKTEEPPNFELLLQKLLPEDRDTVRAAMQAMLKGGVPYHVEYRIPLPLGKFRFCLSRGKVTERNAEGLPIRVSGTVTDITPLKLAQQALQRSVKEMTDIRFALDQSAIVAITDNAGLFTYVNQEFCRVSKYSEEQLLGQKMQILDSDYHPGEYFKTMWDTIKSGQVWHGEFKNRASDGTFFWLASTIVPFLDLSGKPYQYVAIDHDITAQKEVERALAESNRDLEFFASTASHDLQAPLRKIRIFSEQLMKDQQTAFSAEGQDIIQRIHHSAETAEDLVKDLLALSKVSQSTLQDESVDLNLVITNVLGNLDDQILDKKAEVIIKPLPTIYGDPMQWEQLLHNLIENSLKYHHSGHAPRIQVASWEDPTGQRFGMEVKDDGIGFDSSKAEIIFEPFTRLHGKGQYNGTGIGLAICKRIVERHGGTIRAESEPGKSTRILVELPLTRRVSQSVSMSH